MSRSQRATIDCSSDSLNPSLAVFSDVRHSSSWGFLEPSIDVTPFSQEQMRQWYAEQSCRLSVPSLESRERFTASCPGSTIDRDHSGPTVLKSPFGAAVDGEARRDGNHLTDAGVLAVALLVAVLSARPYADSANDGSRLAAVESLVDHHTLAIDESVFVKVPPPNAPRRRQPYPFVNLENGTIDKLKVGDHFYSDKPYTLSLYLAGWYWVLQQTIGLEPRERVDLFCWWMTLLSSGVAYVVAVWCVYRMGRTVGLATSRQLLLAGSFGLCTVALPYAQHVNSHIVLLALAAALIGLLARTSQGKTAPCWSVFGLGTLAGLGYAIEQGVGQLLWGWALLAVSWRWGLRRAVLFLAASLPWLALHHAVNYAIGGTLGPANAVPEYFDYPGSTFDASNLTGRWSHQNGLWFLGYAGGLLVSDRGFLTCNLPLGLLLPGAIVLIRSRTADWVAAFGAAWALCTYLLYATLSSNFSGWCLSIRWFVPLLAPGFYAVALLLRHFPHYRGDFLLLSSWGLILAGLMWQSGMWQARVPFFWPLVGAALATWIAYRLVNVGQVSNLSA